MDEVNDATDRVIAGLEGRALSDNSAKRLIAYHEAGHALVGTLLPYHDPVNKVTLVPRGQAKGPAPNSPILELLHQWTESSNPPECKCAAKYWGGGAVTPRPDLSASSLWQASLGLPRTRTRASSPPTP